MSIKSAIQLLQEEMDALGTPKEDTREWWILRARALGLSLLKAIELGGLTTIQAEAFRKVLKKELTRPNVAETPALEAVVAEPPVK